MQLSILCPNGPLYFRIAEYNGSLPTLTLSPHSWTKVSNVIFLDSPVGAGFSYSTSLEGSHTGDIKSSQQAYEFLRKWLTDHPDFLDSPLYIAGLSYSGLTIPVIVQEISDGNDAGNEPFINLKGYLLGNPGTNRHTEVNSRVPFAHGMGLISDELYESFKKNCDGEYMNFDPGNTKCVNDIESVKKCLSGINDFHILEPICSTEAIEPKRVKRDKSVMEAYPGIHFESTQESCSEDSINVDLTVARRIDDTLVDTENAPDKFKAHYPAEMLNAKMNERTPPDEYSSEVPLSPPLPRNPVLECRTYGYKLAYYWANDLGVQKALHIRKGTVEEWIRCNRENIPYEKDATGLVSYHLRLSSRGIRSLIFSGDHDIMVPYVGTQEWIRSLNFSIVDDWRPWYVGGHLAGYTRGYANNLTFATVKGAGHEVPMYKPKECFAMFKRWIFHNPL